MRRDVGEVRWLKRASGRERGDLVRAIEVVLPDDEEDAVDSGVGSVDTRACAQILPVDRWVDDIGVVVTEYR